MQVGMLSSHLRVLAAAGMVLAEPEGNHLRYFPAHGFILFHRKALSHLRDRTSRAILIHVLDHGSMGFSELLGPVWVSKHALSYHFKRLAVAGPFGIKKGEGLMVSVADPERLVNLLGGSRRMW